jgi:threonine dehydratase
MFSLEELEQARALVRSAMPTTPQYAWPLLRRRFGLDVIVKHENHTPSAAA